MPLHHTFHRVASGLGFYWIRVVLVCAVLVGSGGIRSWQAWKVSASLEQGKKSSFSLKELPLTLGSWQGEDAILDPQIARRTGASDAIFRRYVDQTTGTTVEVIVLYGPAVELFIHMPEVCYSGAGYSKSAGPDQRVIASEGVEAPFRSLVFVKGARGGVRPRGGLLLVALPGPLDSPARHDRSSSSGFLGCTRFKLARRLTVQGCRDVANPCESLLGVLVPEIEHRLAPAS